MVNSGELIGTTGQMSYKAKSLQPGSAVFVFS
jgi:hypothetical protein